MAMMLLLLLAALARAQDCVRSSYEYLDVAIDVNRELAPQIEAKCNTTSCGFRQVLTEDWSQLRVSHRHPRLVQQNDSAPVWPVLMAPELPASLAAADLCEKRNLNGFECRSLKQIARENRPDEWCVHDPSKAESVPAQGRLLKSFDFDERGNDIPPTPSLCGPNAPSLHSAYCEGAYLFVDEPRDGATYQPTLQRGTFSPSLRIRNADGSSRDFMDVLRDDLDLNATIATSVDLYTWSISRYPRDAESLPVFGYLRMAVGTHSLYVVILDGSGRPLAEPIRATFRCELQGNEGRAASDAFPSHDDGNAAKTWYLQRPWQLPGRAEVLRRNGYQAEARASEALFLALGEWTGQSELQPFRDFTTQKPPSENKYVSFRSPPNGLSNQRRDIATMVLIANALRRKFVLPFLFTYGEDGSKMRFLDFGEIYDEDYFIDTLSSLGVSAEPEIITRNRSIAAHKRGEIAERDCSPDPDVGEDFYRERMGSVTDEFLHVVWPAGTYSQTTMLNLFDEPVRLPKIRDAFRWSAKISVRASELASEARRLHGPRLGCLHLRVENDWKSHAISLGKATQVPHDNLYWVDGDEAVRRVAAHPAFANVDVVFLAVGNDTDTPPPSTLNGAPLLNRKNLTSLSVLSDAWDPEADHLLARAALDMAVCEQADVVAGNTWSSFFQELSAFYHARGKPAVAYNAPGRRAALVTDGGVLGSPFDATRKPLSSSNDQALFHVPVDLCSADNCGRWTMSVYGAQSAEESVEAFLAEIDDADVRDAVDDAFVFQRPVHLYAETSQSTQVKSASDTTRAGGARPPHGAARGPRGVGLPKTDGRARRVAESRRRRGRSPASLTGRGVQRRERRVECGKAPGRRRARRHDARIRGRLRRRARGPAGVAARRVLRPGRPPGAPRRARFQFSGGPALAGPGRAGDAFAPHHPAPPRASLAITRSRVRSCRRGARGLERIVLAAAPERAARPHAPLGRLVGAGRHLSVGGQAERRVCGNFGSRRTVQGEDARPPELDLRCGQNLRGPELGFCVRRRLARLPQLPRRPH
jgi:hypothetical protein